MKTVQLVAVLLPLVLAGCTSAEEEARQNAQRWAAIRANDRAQCLNYGFREATPEYAQCRMAIDQQRQANNDALVRGLLIQRMR